MGWYEIVVMVCNRVPIHLGGAMSRPRLTIDSETLIVDGKYLV